MAVVNKQESNFTGCRYAVEESAGVLPGSPVWIPLEPNSYKNFGADIKTKARMPINPTRQLKKGVVTDLDASAGLQQDLTPTNSSDILQSFMFAAARTKAELAITDVDGTANKYEPASGGATYVAGDLLFAKGFADAVNNGLKVVSGTPDATNVPVTDTGLVTASTQTGVISLVGHQFAAGDLSIDATGTYPAIVTAGRHWDTFGLIPGEFVFVGGDSTDKFFHPTSNGFARIRSITTTRLSLDKTQQVMVNDDGTSNGAGGTPVAIRVFFGRVLKNEADTSKIIKRSVQLERTLGAPDDSSPSQIQAEYIIRSMANELKIDMKTADIIKLEMDFLGSDNELRSGATGVKTGSRPTLVETDAFNTTSDVSFTKMAIVTDANSCPTPLFSYFTDLTMDVKNNLKQNKAVSVLGAFDVTPGFFQVSASVTAYFQNVAEMQAVKDNKSMTLEVHLVKFNKGITLDLPLITMSKAVADVKLNEPIMIPLASDAATAALIDPNLDYTLLWVFWDYLPNAAG